MSLWLGILIASIAVYSWKIGGFLLPAKILDHPKISKIASLLTVALLSALTGVQMFTSGAEIVFDARIPALGLAALLLYFRLPFIVTVAAAAVLAAIIRFFS